LKVIDYIREQVTPKVAFDDSLFTRRELRLMSEISERIPYALAIADTDPNREAILDAASEYEGIAAAAPRGH
jgi:hypothetical protein